ncbi:MAG TPA: hypothetical protein VFZ49_08400 [Pyrinomonadaceae bacterium]
MIKIDSKKNNRGMVLAALLVSACVVFAGIGALTSQGFAQSESQFKLRGIIDDFTPELDANGPWQTSGEWSLDLIGNSGRGNFSVAINMVRAENLNRSAHTHHVMLTNAAVTPLPNGFRLSGDAVITGNGNLAGFSGSTLNVDVTGGNTVAHSNIALTFEGGAVGHFGGQPLHGVVSLR